MGQCAWSSQGGPQACPSAQPNPIFRLNAPYWPSVQNCGVESPESCTNCGRLQSETSSSGVYDEGRPDISHVQRSWLEQLLSGKIGLDGCDGKSSVDDILRDLEICAFLIEKQYHEMLNHPDADANGIARTHDMVRRLSRTVRTNKRRAFNTWSPDWKPEDEDGGA